MESMRKPKKTSYSSEPSLRDKLSASFVDSVMTDWEKNRDTAISELRQTDIVKYCELVSKLISPPSAPASPYASAQSVRDVGRLLMQQVGADPEMVTDEMADEAVAANLKLIETLQTIKERDL